MKSDFDALMPGRKLDAIIVFGNAEHNPLMRFMTGGGYESQAMLIKKRGEAAILSHVDMLRDVVGKSRA